MTDKQALYRWRFRHDFLENWLAGILSGRRKVSRKAALTQVQMAEERAMALRNIRYPIEATDR